MKKNLSIYIHIPFCVKKCKYCDFLSFDDQTYAVQLQYINALRTEISMYRQFADRYIIKTIFFGGGTPSMLDESLIETILSTIRSVFEVDRFPEITLEANPGTLKYTNLLAYYSYGINRLSIGLQSANDELLKKLGRIHNYDQFVAGFTSARRAGFQNISVDVMSGIPGQTMRDLADTLTRVMEYRPEHISVYGLQVEEETPLSKDTALLKEIPDEETDRNMYAATKTILATNGYDRYEFSNYCQPGFESRHNIVYWTGGEYLGFGLGASSYFKGERFSNIKDIRKYLEIMEDVNRDMPQTLDKYKFFENVSKTLRSEVTTMYIDRRIEEFMFLGLRMIKGVSRREFKERFNKDINDVYAPVINNYVEQGFMTSDCDRVALTDAGIDVSNYILSDFILS